MLHSTDLLSMNLPIDGILFRSKERFEEICICDNCLKERKSMDGYFSGTWMKTNVYFGLPCIIYTLRLHGPLLSRFNKLISTIDQNNPKELENAIRIIIIEQRPNLKDGLIIISMEQDFMRDAFNFKVSHPSLPALQMGQRPKIETLELCSICNNPFDNEQTFMKKDNNGNYFTVCSEECVKSDKVLIGAILNY